MNNNNEYLTAKEIGEILKIGRTKTYNLINQSDFPKYRIGGTIRVRRDEFEKYMRGRKTYV